MEPSDDRRAAGFGAAMKAVLWSFFGVRKRRDQERDARLNPVHIVIAGVVATALFVLVLILIVNHVVK